MKMKLPLSIIILLAWTLITTSWLMYSAIQEHMIDANFKEIGTAEFRGSELKVWKVGDCYVFGVNHPKPEDHQHGQPPGFFSNCQK